MKNTKVIEKICKGQSLFEVLIAMAVIALIAVAIASLTIYSVRNNSASRNRSLTNSYAQEGMEWLRQERDDNWGSFKGHAEGAIKTRCLPALDDKGWVGVGCNPSVANDYIPGTIFLREFTLSTEGSEPNIAVIAKMVVKWTDTQGTHKTEIVNKFTNWQSQP